MGKASSVWTRQKHGLRHWIFFEGPVNWSVIVCEEEWSVETEILFELYKLFPREILCFKWRVDNFLYRSLAALFVGAISWYHELQLQWLFVYTWARVLECLYLLDLIKKRAHKDQIVVLMTFVNRLKDRWLEALKLSQPCIRHRGKRPRKCNKTLRRWES